MPRQEPRSRGKRAREEVEGSPSRQIDSIQTFAPINAPYGPSSASSDLHYTLSPESLQPPAGALSSNGPVVLPQPSRNMTAPAPPGKVAIPALKPPKRAESASTTFKKGRTAHACDNCRKAKSGCTGELPCMKCRNAGVQCVYGDGKRDKDRKRLSRLSKETDSLSRQNSDIVEALRRIHLDSDLSKEEMRVAIGSILATTPLSTSGGDSEPYETISVDRELDDSAVNDDETEIGSTGSIDVINVDTDRDDTRATGHMGKSSAVAWAKRTAEECQQSGSRSTSSGRQDKNMSVASYHTEDADFEDGDMSDVNMFEWPDPRLADTLIRSYFDHVHNAFPILDKAAFTLKYTRFRPGSSDLSQEDLIWLGTLNTIFAVSAVLADLTKNQDRGHYNDHLIYIARAKMLCMDQGLLYRDARVSTVCALGLLCLYYVSTCRLNRAWTICGLAIRYAMTLGLHVRSEALETPDVEKEHRVRIWWSLYGLECSLNELTGRPSCMSDRDISTPLPINVNEADFHPGQVLYDRMQEIQSSGGTSRRNSKGSRTRPAATYQTAIGEQSLTYTFPILQLPLTSSTYFIYRTQLSIISHEIVTKLYCAATIKEKWSDVQAIIRGIDQRLQKWKETLPSEFNIDFDTFNEPDWSDPYLLQRTGLAMLFNSSRMILFRPCLCRFEGRLKKMSEKSQDFSQDAVVTCIQSARKMISLLSWSASSVTKLYAIPPWWNTLNYLCEALSVLMLEMAFQSQHMPREAAYILEDAKKGVNWLVMMAGQSISARKAWEIFDKLIRLVAPLINWSVFDMPTEAPLPQGYNWRRGTTSTSQQAFQPQAMQQTQEHNQLSEAHLQQFQRTQPLLSHPAATTSWTSQPPSFQPPTGRYNQAHSEQSGNPLDHTEALNRFSSIGNVHGRYDDPWMHMFGLREDGAQFTTATEEQYGTAYPQFGNLGDNANTPFGAAGAPDAEQYQGEGDNEDLQRQDAFGRGFGY